MSSIIKPIGDKNFYEKKVLKSKKYEGVNAKIDSGFTVDKFLKKNGGGVFAHFKREEKFRRVSRTELASLMVNNDEPTDSHFLLLDVRDPDEFEKCSINGSFNYPAPFISRSVNPYTPEILKYV